MPSAIVRVLAQGACAFLVALLLSGCANRPLNLPAGPEAYAIFPPGTELPPRRDYLIGPSDQISVATYNEPEFSMAELRVDTAGNVNLPLIGRVNAAGKTTEELGNEIATSFRTGGYLQTPSVTVNIIQSVSQQVTVDGEVVQPGIYSLTGPTTLLDAIAMSRGTTRTARTEEIAVFRVIDGTQKAAKFDLAAIRRGEMPDPTLQGDDVVVVGFDNVAGTWQTVLSSAPFFLVFLELYQAIDGN
ncbi:MAG TPA: polysaccharide biosynthesis/export family protein [Croceibacterium sp.]